jgi:hypothetical protein
MPTSHTKKVTSQSQREAIKAIIPLASKLKGCVYTNGDEEDPNEKLQEGPKPKPKPKLKVKKRGVRTKSKGQYLPSKKLA